ncbi:response regulator transcription factor [Francisella sp. LA112445]|jgi:DNA-binding response OmpR family regulator|uniref:response regulator transcription factor n=1 Tax=Francisella sp. LA112445 TaxID=1395624 RepID=UPI001788A7A0|nr:response regulator transcription factor [Francisella sp. LA112445]QIW09707.1 response regulator transcription factor [Francisella sp. LA112445]
MNILIVDDDKKICSMLKLFFEKYNYKIDIVHSGEEAIEILYANHEKYDVVTLDIHMHGICGIETCKKIREFSDIPILMVTSSQDDINTILALEVGADDYVIKPFNPMVLYSRIKNVIKRSHKQEQVSVNKKTVNYAFCNCILDTSTQTLKYNGKMIPITTGVYRVLKYFLENPNIVLSRELLMEQTQNRSLENFDRSIDIQISRLRKILKDIEINDAIKTIHGSGYMWTQEVTLKSNI